MINEGNTLSSNQCLHGKKTVSKRQSLTSSDAGNKIGGGHEHPKSANAKRRSNLVLVQSKILLGLTKEDLNRPACQIAVQYDLRGETGIRTDKSTQGLGQTEGFLWVGNQDDSIFQIIQVSLVTIHIILPLANGNKVDIGISLMDIRGKLGNLPLDSNWENHPVRFERTNGLEAFC